MSASAFRFRGWTKGRGARLSESGGSLGGARVWTALFVVFYLILLLRDAWVSDDAYITLRAVDQLLAGNGPVHNADERVQGYTHPLWMLLLSVVCALTGELYFAPLLLGVVCSVLAAWVLGFRLAPRAPLAPAAVLVLGLSRSFIDYSTSGLENPLTFLLVGCFFTRYFAAGSSGGNGPLRLRGEALLASLIALNRLDAVLLVVPALAESTWSSIRGSGGSVWERSRRAFWALATGFVPLLAWELFSLVYYGGLVPNTALAKLGTGIARGESIAQGLVYLRESFAADYLLAVLVMASPLLLVAVRDARTLAGLVGAWLSLAYVVAVGGDFMVGRFVTPAAFAILAVATHLSRGWNVALDRTLLAVTLASGATPGSPVGLLPPRPQRFSEHGIANERRFYEGNTGLMSWVRGRSMPQTPWREEGEWQRDDSAVRLGAIGIHSAFSSRDARVVDEWGLVDPLLARLPAVYEPTWRIGHFRRAIPAGYLELRDRGVGELHDGDLAKLYRHVRRIVSGPIWSRERWWSIWLANTGQLGKYAHFDRYRYFGSKGVAEKEVSREERRASVLVAGQGVRVELTAPRVPYLGLGLRRGARYRILLLERGRVLHTMDLEPASGDFGAPERMVLEIPPAAQGADTLRVVTRGEGEGYLDHLVTGADERAVTKRLDAWRERVKLLKNKRDGRPRRE